VRMEVSAAEIWVELFNEPLARLDPIRSRPIHDIMKNLEGWERAPWKTQRGGGYGKQIIYLRSGPPG